MSRTKIVDEREVIRWLEEGRTYAWMSEQYRTKYHVDVTPSTFSNFRARQGLPRRIHRDDDLLPWHVAPEHKHAYDAQMLRAEARRRAGIELKKDTAARLDSWKAHLEREGLVIDYSRASGFARVPRRAGVDTDLIRAVERKTTVHPNADQRRNKES